MVNTKLSDYFKKDGSTEMTGDLNTGGQRIINLRTPRSNSEPATKFYIDSQFLNLNGQSSMNGNLNMNNKQIYNLPLPTGSNQPTILGFTDLKYLHRDGTVQWEET